MSQGPVQVEIGAGTVWERYQRATLPAPDDTDMTAAGFRAALASGVKCQVLNPAALGRMREIVAEYADVDLGFPMTDRCGCGWRSTEPTRYHQRGGPGCNHRPGAAGAA